MAITPVPNVDDNWSPELRSELETHAADPLPGTRLPPGGERVDAGTEDIVFTTAEFLDSANDPLPLAPGQRA
jgi:hypothetical protein